MHLAFITDLSNYDKIGEELLKTYEQLEKTSKVISNLYSVIGFLVLWDIMTTYINMSILSDKFGEYGLIANMLMKLFGDVWGVAMFPLEFAIFGLLTYAFSKGNRIIRIRNVRLELRHLPALALGVLVVNNVTNLALFLLIFG